MSPNELFNGVKVFVNGTWLGNAEGTHYELYYNLKDKKYKGIINIFTHLLSLIFSRKEIRMCNDAGRLNASRICALNNSKTHF